MGTSTDLSCDGIGVSIHGWYIIGLSRPRWVSWKECDPGRIDLRWDEWRIDCRHKDSSRLLLSIQLWDQVSQARRRIRWFFFDWDHDGGLVVIWVCFWKCLMCIHCRKVAIMIWPSWWWTSTSISIWRRWKVFWIVKHFIQQMFECWPHSISLSAEMCKIPNKCSVLSVWQQNTIQASTFIWQVQIDQYAGNW